MSTDQGLILRVLPIWTPPALHDVAPGRWPGIRNSLLRERGPVCEICGFVAQESRYIDAHEVFEYPDDGRIRLVGIQLLCKRCHDCKHFDQLLAMEKSGVRERGRSETLIEHFCRVNRCSRVEFGDNLQTSRRRSEELRKRYGSNPSADQVDYGPYQDTVARYRSDGSALNWWVALVRIRKHANADRLDPDAGVFDNYDFKEIAGAVREDDHTRKEIVRLVNAGNHKGAYAVIVGLMAEVWDYDDGELFPDHEFPEATHMWREIFGGG